MELKQFYVVNDNLTCYSDEPAVIEVQIGQSIELTIEATPGEIVREGTEISLIVTSSNNDHGAFEWFRDGQALETTFDATLSLPDFYESGEYKAMTTTSHDCPGVASVYLVAEVFIPNIITPYNENSLNDKFMQGSRSIQRVEIFNRYQQRIYEGDEGWDGTFRGQLAEPGTYFYRVVMKDGNVRKGTIEVAKF